MSFWKSKTRIDSADRLFSLYIRKRDGNRCCYCGVDGKLKQLEASHFFGRAMESVRFDPENVDTFCRSCHANFEDKKGMTYGKHGGVIVEVPAAYRAWKIYQLGEKRFNALEVRAHTHVKKDRKMSMLIVKALMAELDGREKILGVKA